MRSLTLASAPVLLALLSASACGGGGTSDASSGGAFGSGGVAVGSGGVAPGVGGASGGASTGGTTSTGGGVAAGGTTSTGGQLGESGGASSGGASGGTDGGGGGGSSAAVPSPGCEAGSTRPQNGVLAVNNSHFFGFPEDYDGTTPMPVLFGFHGCGGENRGDGSNSNSTEYFKLTNGTVFASDYIRAVPLSNDGGGCWNYNNDISRAKEVFTTLSEDYCIDLSRVYATGHSSGAQFIVQMLLSNRQADAAHFGFAGVAPVAASDYGAMSGPIPVMYIQGYMDKERNNGDGHETVERFRAANSCGSSSADYDEVMGCQSSGTSVDPGCVVYDGCAAPTIWCSHNDPQYGGTYHGVPCFAMTAMGDFFAGLSKP